MAMDRTGTSGISVEAATGVMEMETTTTGQISTNEKISEEESNERRYNHEIPIFHSNDHKDEGNYCLIDDKICKNHDVINFEKIPSTTSIDSLLSSRISLDETVEYHREGERGIEMNSGYQYQSEISSSRAPQDLTLDAALEKIPVGKFHLRLLTLCGLSFMSDSIEVSLLSFLSLYVAAEWNLSVAQLASITAVVFAGALIGSSMVWGPLADRYGRRVSFLIGSYLISICSLASALSSNFYCLILFRFFVGIGVGSGFVPFDLLAEFLPASHRGQYLMNINYFWTTGSMIVNGTAWVFLESYGWRVFIVISTLPVLLGAVLATIYLPESPRWLLHQLRPTEAENVIYHAAKVNNTELSSFHLIPMTTSTYSKLPSSTHSMSHNHQEDSPDIIYSITQSSLHSSKIENMVNGEAQHDMHIRHSHHDQNDPQKKNHQEEEITWEHYIQLLQPEYVSITAPLWIVYLSYGVTYYGAILFISRLYSSESSESHQTNHVTFNYFDIFTNACSEIVGVLLASNIIDRIGRKISQVTLYCVAAFSVLLLPFASSNVRYFISLICRISILAACGITWVATPELYPTSLRAVGHSICTAFSRMGAMIAPYIIQNRLISEKEIGIILCFLNMISMLSIAYLPETLGKSMEATKKT